MILAALASELARSTAGSKRLPASRTVTRMPAPRANSDATRLPQAPAPITITSGGSSDIALLREHAFKLNAWSAAQEGKCATEDTEGTERISCRLRVSVSSVARFVFADMNPLH